MAMNNANMLFTNRKGTQLSVFRLLEGTRKTYGADKRKTYLQF